MSHKNKYNAMTVDVEDYYQVSAFEKFVGYENWDKYESRVKGNTDKILELFDKHNVKATFFILGWVAERLPEMVREIDQEGHEIASHGYRHMRVTQHTREQFREDIVRTKTILEDIISKRINGYRAASYSITNSNIWAIEELKDAGYIYSSSIYPVKHDLYGIPDAPRYPYYPLGEKGVLEIPITTIKIFGRNFPAGGGGFFRLYPYFLSRSLLSRINNRENSPAIFYFHPWEIDQFQPKINCSLPLKTRFRHYFNLSKTYNRLDRLLGDFKWARIDDVFLSE